MKTRAVSEGEIRSALGQLKGKYSLRDQCLFAFLHRTGYRLSEALSVRVGDVYDADTGTVRDEVSVLKQHMKGKSKSRAVPLHREAKWAIASWINASHLTTADSARAHLFASQKGGPLSRVQAWRLIKRAFRQIGSAAGCAAHSFRKRFGTDVYQRSGRCIITTQLALGHVDPTHTSAYIAITRAQIDGAILDVHANALVNREALERIR